MAAVRHASFAPHVAPDTRLLILGSLPGARSLAERQYYAHPTNRFWQLIGGVIDRPLAMLPYAERLAALREAKIGLWDVIRSAERRTSSDSHIREADPHDLAALVAVLPDLRMVAFNGGKVATIGRKQLPPLKLSMHMWNDVATQRFVIIDGTRLTVGDRLGALVVADIVPDGVLLDWNGRALKLPLR